MRSHPADCYDVFRYADDDDDGDGGGGDDDDDDDGVYVNLSRMVTLTDRRGDAFCVSRHHHHSQTENDVVSSRNNSNSTKDAAFEFFS